MTNMMHGPPGKISHRFYGPEPGTRTSPDSILQTVDVFPHGYCDLQANFSRWVDSLEMRTGFPGFVRSSLKPYRNQFVNQWRGAKTEPRILSKQPWSNLERHPSMPDGYFQRAVGSTQVWVEYWHWCRSSPWDFLETTPDPKGTFYESYLEVSSLTWFFEEIGDYETSLIIELHKHQVLLHGVYIDAPFTSELIVAAGKLASAAEEFLRSHPPIPDARNRRAGRSAS